MSHSDDSRRTDAEAAPSAVEGAMATQTDPDPSSMRLEERDSAVVLLSGGLDSATTLALAQARGLDCFALTIEYGQRHAIELERARSIALFLGVPLRSIAVDLGSIGGSALTDDIDVPAAPAPDEIGREIPVTYVPARNTIFLSLALAWAETLECDRIFIGANVRDYSGYPDCRPEYLRAFEKVANLGTRAGVSGETAYSIEAPLIQMTKAEIIRCGAELGVPFQLTHSCYDPDESGRACGLCDACIIRRQGFAEAGVDDPTPYAS